MVDARWVAGLLAAALAAGCETHRGPYDWGSYQASVRALYAPTALDSPALGAQIQQLEREIQQSNNDQSPNAPSRVPPGKYAHLGYLYTVAGDRLSARRCFESEKSLYPESTVFIDGILTRMP
jgi:hypothetical protein